MKKIIILLIAVFAFAITTLKPYKFYRYNYYISKIAYNQKYLIIGLENGKILINNFKTNKKIHEIILPKIHDFMGELISMPIYSLDISPNGNNLMIMTQGENTVKKIFIYNFKTKKLKLIYSTKKTLMKAKYTDNNHIFIALLGDEIELLNIKNKKISYKNQIGNYVFSTYSLNKSKTKAVIGDESGIAKVVDVKNGKKLFELNGFNKDKTISLDFVKNYIINGSSDKRLAIYNINSKNSILNLSAKFLPYASAISPNLKKFAFQYNENNDIMVKNINNKPLFLLKGHSMPLINMRFLNNNEIISYSPAEIIRWKLK